MDNRREIGSGGEDAAARFLRANGYRILERNVRALAGEIDVVARDGQTLCFIEIKTRRSLRFGWPEESVSPFKRRKLVLLAKWYMRYRKLPDARVRFDVVSILLDSDGKPGRTRLIKSAFEASG